MLDRIGAIPGLTITPVEATYLAWIGVGDAAGADPVEFFEGAGVGLYDGRVFGAQGYVRLNFGCPRSTLERGLERIERALQGKR